MERSTMKTQLTTPVGVCLIVLAFASRGDSNCEDSLSVYRIPGHVYFAGIFDGHTDENCSTPAANGLQQMAAAAAITKALQDVNYILGINIGIALYDSCSSISTAQKVLAAAKLESECMDSTLFGILTTPDTYKSFQSLARSLLLSTATTSDPFNSLLLFDMTASLLVQLGWTAIDTVIAEDSLMLDSFEEAATLKLLCIKQRRLLSETIELKLDGRIVVIAEMSKLNSFTKDNISSAAHVLFVPIGGDFHLKSDLLPSKSYIILPSDLKLAYDFNENSTLADENNSTRLPSEISSLGSVEGPIFVQMAADILQMIDLLKSDLQISCSLTSKGKTVCENFLTTKKQLITNPILRSARKTSSVLKTLELEHEGFELFKLVKNLEEESIFTTVGSYNLIEEHWTWILDDENKSELLFCKRDPIDNTTAGIDCSHCSNFKELYRRRLEELQMAESFITSIVWKTDAWVAAMLTISAVGIICVIAVGIFILVRICKQDILEGNPTYSFLLLFAIILTYASCLPFSFDLSSDNPLYSGIACNLRIFGTTLSYSFIFSIMLARCFMIASCDQDGGFMSHINGYLQTVVCFFIVAVQIALSIQFGAMNWKFLSTDDCMSLTQGYLFITMLSYDMFLLVLLIVTAPFVIKSKRNYHEGGFFATASVLCLFAWGGWVTGFVLLPEKWHDMVISCGLCATGTIILVTVFIPRTYLMMTGIVRDHLASTLPSLAYASSSSVIDVVNYRSTQALYDSVNPVPTPKGQVNPNFYSDRPGTPSTSKMDSIQRIEHRNSDNTYERYDTPTSPLNVTRF